MVNKRNNKNGQTLATNKAPPKLQAPIRVAIAEIQTVLPARGASNPQKAAGTPITEDRKKLYS